jgi:hypothetical protein
VELAALQGVSSDSIRRHARRHPPKALVKATEVAAITEADSLLTQAQRPQREALGVLEHAKAEGNLGGVLQAIDRLQGRRIARIARRDTRGRNARGAPREQLTFVPAPRERGVPGAAQETRVGARMS